MFNLWFFSEEQKEFWEKEKITLRLGLENLDVKLNIARKDPVITYLENYVIVPVHTKHSEFYGNGDSNFFNNISTKVYYWLRAFPEIKIVFIDPFEVKPIIQSYGDSINRSLGAKIKEFNLKNQIIFINCNGNILPGEDSRLDFPHIMKGGILYPQYTYPFLYSEQQLKDFSDVFLRTNRFTKKVINLNGRHRQIRTLLLLKLIERIPQSDLIYTFYGLDTSMNIENELLILQTIKDKSPTLLSELEIKSIEQLLLKAPISSNADNIEELYSKNFNQIFLPEFKTYSDVFVDIFSETLANREYDWRDGYGDGFFMTEKTCKPILALRPFIVNSNQGYLEYLKSLGFKTFNTWFDESYDKVTQVEESLNCILKNVELINNLSIEECRDMYEDMIPTLMHNRKVLLDLIYNQRSGFLNAIFN